MFRITSKYFSIFSNTPTASSLVHTMREYGDFFGPYFPVFRLNTEILHIFRAVID